MYQFFRVALLGTLSLGLSFFAQNVPCDQVGGNYCNDDLLAVLPMWRVHGTAPTIPDHDNNGSVDVRDFIGQGYRDASLWHGLLGQYWGFADGSEDQSIEWPDFASPPYDPIWVQPTPDFTDFISYDRHFLNTTMRRNFGAVFTGFLWVPESSEYTFSLRGREGIRLYFDDALVLEFEGFNNPRTWQSTLTKGLHPIRIEYYTDDRAPYLSVAWENEGSIIGPGAKTIKAEYFYHRPISVTRDQVSEMSIQFSPESGKRVDGSQTQLDLRARILSVDQGTSLEVQGQAVDLINGNFASNIALEPGLNQLTFKVTNSIGKTYETVYSVYRDNEVLAGSGLMVNAYVKEHYTGIIPDTVELGLQPWISQPLNSTQLAQDQQGRLILDGHFHGPGSVLELEGLMQINDPGWYRFRLIKGGSLEINGTFIAAIGAHYPRQFDHFGDIYLDAGFHHYRHKVGASIFSPTSDVRFRFGGEDKDFGPERKIPDGIFAHSEQHRHPAPNPVPIRTNHQRRTDHLVAEYLFTPGHVYGDSSGYGNDLTPDPRVVPIPSGGIQLESGTALFSHQAGVHSVARIVETQNFSLEIDFILDREVNDHNSYELMSISNGALQYLARLRLRNNDLFFSIDDQNGTTETLRFNNVINDTGRYYLVGTYDGSVARLYLNGELLGAPQTMNLNLRYWQKRAYVTVGPQFTRRFRFQTVNQALPGRIMGTAVYARQLSPADQIHNMAENLALNPTTDRVPPPAPIAFPPPEATQAALDETYHVLNRLTFGPSPTMVSEVLRQGVDNWIEDQLDPDKQPDPGLTALIDAEYFLPTNHRRDLQALMIFRMAQNPQQLREVMTQFWDNHFNTQLMKTFHIAAEKNETERFRDLALGRFADLLFASAHNFPMTVYLDNDSNSVGAPNENYAREIMELHTVGVNGGYTHEDIVEAARVFTGWTVYQGQFYFDPGHHDFGAKTIMGLNLPAGGGLNEGRLLIQHLVGLPQTADFITYKMCQLLIADDPPQDVRNAAAAAFRNNAGDISATLRAIVNHPRFRTDLNLRMNKTKTPLEFMISLMRATEAFPLATNLPDALEEMGMPLLEFADPTGFSEESVDWIDTNAVLLRLNFANSLAMNRGSGHSPEINIRGLLQRYGAETPAEILDLISSLTTHGREHPEARALAMQWLTGDDPNFELTDEILDTRVRQVLSFYLKLPEMSRQ